jgi:molybdate transport system substrate-binding protein
MRPTIVPMLLASIVAAACSTPAPSFSPSTSAPSVVPSTGPSASASTEAVDLTVFTAASLSGALAKIKHAYEAANPGTTLTVSTDSSAALETKIEQGAPADVFLAADTANPKKLVDSGLAAGEALVFAGNKLTIVVPTDNPSAVSKPTDLATPGLKVIAAGDEVPITKYAKQLVANIAKEPDAPAGFEAAYAANVASKEDNVKAVIGKIELGEGDAGIVYVTDAKASTKVATVDVPDAVNVPASYAGVVVGASTHQEPARTFLGWLTGVDGRAILASFGFLPPAT